MTVWTFHCKAGEYADLYKRMLEHGWIVASQLFSRGEWHVCGVKKQWLFELPEQRRETIMQRLAYIGDKSW
jgi:hypothetical protein